ncbi:hypothetical protein XENORESO_000013 [Xenotaenia resolanae]|uniref:Uncharacterized protein n=1 Tax=Xenotaenia resolanae TaxID=208358 RepID=A0ABV0WQE7_9TELE
MRVLDHCSVGTPVLKFQITSTHLEVKYKKLEQNAPEPLTEKPFHSMMLPPPCLTTEVFLDLKPCLQSSKHTSGHRGPTAQSLSLLNVTLFPRRHRACSCGQLQN